MASTISAIVPRYVIAKSVNSVANPMDEFLKFKTECVDSDGSSSSNGSTTVGRKRKLDHLTQEEKIQRKKLKNRVAAQTSRDRKKAKMEDMEHKIATQAKEIKTLTDACKQLKKEKTDLEQVCKDLASRCETLEKKMAAQEEKSFVKTSNAIGSTTKFNGSAVGIGGRVNRTRCKQKQQPECIEPDSSTPENNNPLHGIQDWIEGCDVEQLERLADSLLGDLAAEIEKDQSGEENSIPNSTLDQVTMGTTTNGSRRTTNDFDVKPKSQSIRTAFKSEIPIETTDEPTFYPTTCEDSQIISQNLIKQDLDPDDFIQHEIEISDLEDDTLYEEEVEESQSLVISNDFSNDHSYNKPSPIFDTIICEEPLSPISSSSSRDCPDVTTTLSDYGYESQNSPSASSIEDMPLINLDEFPFWDDPITELFPSLA